MTSFIDDIKKIEEKQIDYVVNSQDTNTQSMANYLPNGKLYQAKNIENTNMRKMLSSLALEIIRAETAIKTIADEFYPFTTTDLISEWEAALLIPDECFRVEGVSLEQRRRQIVAKLAIDNIITREDFIALAKFFGYTITIKSGFESSVFPGTFPMLFAGSAKEQKFTMIVTFHNIPAEDSFPYTFPMTFPTEDVRNFLECLIVKLSPANVQVIFETSTT